MANLEQLTTEEKKENRKLLSALGIIVVIVAAMAIIGFLFINKPAEIIEGQAEATSVRVSGKLGTYHDILCPRRRYGESR